MVELDTQDRRRLRGDASRQVVLHRATDLASVEGLDGLTIGRLAETSGRSKSSVATLFHGKEGLQLATIAAARDIFVAAIIDPARAEPRGLQRLVALLRNALAYSRDRVFTGGCFFYATAADVDSKPGPVNAALRTAFQDWYDYVEAQARAAIAARELHIDPDQAERLTFDLLALDQAANARSLLLDDDRPYTLAAASMRERLAAAGADPSALEPLAP
jgi:AcrR family transcriptional regulator